MKEFTSPDGAVFEAPGAKGSDTHALVSQRVNGDWYAVASGTHAHVIAAARSRSYGVVVRLRQERP